MTPTRARPRNRRAPSGLAMRAFLLAQEAKTKFETHEGICTQRWVSAKESSVRVETELVSVKGKQDKILWWIIGTAVVMIGGMLAILAQIFLAKL